MTEKYVILIHEPWTDQSDATDADWAEMWKQHHAFSEAVAAAGGTVTGGEALEPVSAGFRVDGFGTGSSVVTDGPFGETKEVVSGFYSIEVPDGADVRTLAGLVPTANWVEVRQVMDLPEG